MDEPKLCPFCGGQPGMDSDIAAWWVSCLKCDARGPLFSQYHPMSDEDAAREAWAAWNSRDGGENGGATG